MLPLTRRQLPGDARRGMTYEYEVFVSYRRAERLQPGGVVTLGEEGVWVHDVFLPVFRNRLDHCFPGARIAFDANLPYGIDWEPTIQRWVLRSKCLVAVWSPMYFRSRYCRTEFHSMLQRQRQRGAPDGGAPEPAPLVVPLAFSRSNEWFDDDAKALQYARDLAEFSDATSPIRIEERRMAFVAALDRLCDQVRAAIGAAPDWRPDFPWIQKEALPPAHAYQVPSLQRGVA